MKLAVAARGVATVVALSARVCHAVLDCVSEWACRHRSGVNDGGLSYRLSTDYLLSSHRGQPREIQVL